MDKAIKMDKKSIVADLYQAAIISVFAVGYSMLRKKILKIALQASRSSIWKTQENWLLSLLHQR